MSQSLDQGPLRDAAILTRAVENVFRKLIRLLIGKMSLTKLQEMIRIIFVEEVERKLKQERPGKKIPMSKLGALTGLDTRTLHKIINKSSTKEPLHKKDRFLREITPESSILDFWSSNTKYVDSSTMKPLVLPLRGESPSFESLVGEVHTPRGVTVGSLIESLVESKSVVFEPTSNSVSLRNRQYLYFENKEAITSLEAGLASVSNLLETLVHNFSPNRLPSDRFFERSNWTHRLNPADLLGFRIAIRNYLNEAETGSVEILSEYENDEFLDDQITAGVSIFYFEESRATNNLGS